MALGMQDRSNNFNRIIEMFIRHMQSSKLVNQQMMGYAGLDKMRGNRMEALEGTRHGNQMIELQQKYMNEVARDPLLQQLRAEHFKISQAGGDVSQIESDMKQRIQAVGLAGFNAATGQDMTVEDFNAVAGNLSEETFRTLITTTGQNVRQKEKIRLVDQPGQALTERGQNITLRGQDIDIGKEGTKAAQETFERWNDTVKTAETFLIGEGVQAKEGTTSGSILYGPAKTLDPLSPEHRSEAMFWLGKIRTKLNDNVPLTKADKNFLERVRSSQFFETTETDIGGMPVEATGQFGQETYDKIEKEYRAVLAQQGKEMSEQMILERIANIYFQMTGQRWDLKISEQNPEIK